MTSNKPDHLENTVLAFMIIFIILTIVFAIVAAVWFQRSKTVSYFAGGGSTQKAEN